MKLWHDRRLRLAITRLGLAFLLAMLLMGAFAVNTGNNLLYLLFSLMLGLFLVSGWASRQAIRGLALGTVEEGHLFARVRGGLRVRFRDGAPGRVRGLEVHLEVDGVPVEPGFLAGGKGGGAEVLLVLFAQPQRRGLCRVRRMELRTSYPFGLMEKGWTFELAQDLLILPHPRALSSRQPREGDVSQPRPQAGLACPDGARPFREGDPLSRVHWKRTAQRGAPWVRTFEDERASGLRLHLDPRLWSPGPRFERELELLSGAILQARLHRRPVTLTVATDEGRATHEGPAPCWRALALAQPLAPPTPT